MQSHSGQKVSGSFSNGQLFIAEFFGHSELLSVKITTSILLKQPVY
jgi:hypothetical protein